MSPTKSRRGRFNALRIASLALIACGALPTIAAAATEEQLEARVDALAKELQAVKQELAALKEQRSSQPSATAAAAGAAAPAAAGSALPEPAAPSASSALPSGAPVASQGVTFFGYGELNYAHPTADSSATTADLARFVLGAGYRFNDTTRFVSELELEHAVASSTDVGEIEVEQAYIEHELHPGLYAHAGLILIPSGTLNESHEPTRYYGVFRNFVETAIIPSTWREGGFALQGFTSGGLRWDVGVTTGFDLSKWDPTSTEGRESPLGSIHGELAQAHARDLSGFGAVNYTGIAGVRLGASLFGGGVSQGQPGLPSAALLLWEGHASWQPGRWDLAALYAQGHLSGTSELNVTFVGNPTLVPEQFFGWYLQGAYRLIERGDWSVTPFLRYERFNTGSEYAPIGAGFTPQALPDTKVWTAGLNWTLWPGVVVKADFLSLSGGEEGNRFDLGLGYQF
jgi:hypothetical protein